MGIKKIWMWGYFTVLMVLQPFSSDAIHFNELSVYYGDTIIKETNVFDHDSIIMDSLRYDYSKIREIAYRRKWTKELYRMFFVNPRKINIDVVQTQNSEDRFKPYKGRTIRDINVIVLPPFGTNIYDTIITLDSLRWLSTLANSIHYKSSEKVLKRQMTIKSGDRIEPFEVVQNEILLRDLGNIDDVRIDIVEDNDDPDYVDLYVFCKDEFSWDGELWTNFINSFNIGLENKNLFRRGHDVKYELSYRGRKDQKWGNLAEYNISNVFSTYFDLHMVYENVYEQEYLKVEADRSFLTSRMKWAGGAGYSRYYSSKTWVDKDITKPVEQFNYRLGDVWAGHSFHLPEKYSYNQNIFLTGRFTTMRFVDRPEISLDSNQLYYNRNNVIAAVSYMKIKYFRTNLIYDFGRTEDIPSGLLGTLIFGFENNEYKNSSYVGTEWHYSWFSDQTQRYYGFYAALGSFINKKFERGVFKLGTNYISRLYELKRHRARFYTNIDYIKGFRRDTDDKIYFEDYNIRGIDTDTIVGNQRLSGSIGTTLFLPYIKRGFRASITTFVDAGALANNNKSILKAQTYWGIGFSLNVRNENLVFKNISIRLSFYPKVPPDSHLIQVNMTNGKLSGFYDYKVHKPEIIRYE